MFQVEAAEGRARLQFYLGKAEKETGAGAARSGKGLQGEGGKGAAGRGKRQQKEGPREAPQEEQACEGTFGPGRRLEQGEGRWKCRKGQFGEWFPRRRRKQEWLRKEKKWAAWRLRMAR